MNSVLLTARDPLRAGDGPHAARAARDLAAEGHDVVLVLLEDAVVLARAGHRDAVVLEEALHAGVQVLAEEEALSRRAVARLGEGVAATGMSEVVDLLLGWSVRQAWL
jgi:sulfur transfer complex TusBCD TusB component (DsrH family)